MKQQSSITSAVVIAVRALAAACLLTLVVAIGSPASHAQTSKSATDKPAPIIIKFDKHSAHAGDFIIRRNKDRNLEAKIAKKGLDIAFTEWMQGDHPYVFAEMCIKQ